MLCVSDTFILAICFANERLKLLRELFQYKWGVGGFADHTLSHSFKIGTAGLLNGLFQLVNN